MVAVGDDETLVGHEFDDGGDAAGIGDTPEAMLDTVFVVESGCGLGGEFADGIGVAFVEHEELAAMGAGGAEQVEAIGFGLGERLLVAMDDVVGVVLEAEKSDESVTNVGGAGEIAGYDEALLVGVNAGVGILTEYALRAPVAKMMGRRDCNTERVGVVGSDLPRMMRTRFMDWRRSTGPAWREKSCRRAG